MASSLCDLVMCDAPVADQPCSQMIRCIWKLSPEKFRTVKMQCTKHSWIKTKMYPADSSRQQLSIYHHQWVKINSKYASWKPLLSAGLVVIWFNQYSFDFLAIWEQHNNLKSKRVITQLPIFVFFQENNEASIFVGLCLCLTCNIYILCGSVFGLHSLVRVIRSFSAAKCYVAFTSRSAVLCWKLMPDAEGHLSRGMCKVVIFKMWKKKKKEKKKENGFFQLIWHNPSLWRPQDTKLIWKDVIYTIKAEIFTVAAARSHVKAFEVGTQAWGCK